MATRKNGRGISAMRIIQHRRVHELHKQFIEEEGPERASHLSKSYFAEKIAKETGYADLTVSRIMNEKPK